MAWAGTESLWAPRPQAVDLLAPCPYQHRASSTSPLPLRHLQSLQSLESLRAWSGKESLKV